MRKPGRAAPTTIVAARIAAVERRLAAQAADARQRPT